MKTLVACGVLLAGLSIGCADLRDGVDDSVVSIKARTAAATAWRDSTGIFGGIDDESHFADGFKAGYFNATMYGLDSPPPMPRRYTGTTFRSRRGRQRIQAWIDGFDHGTSIALDEMIPGSVGDHEMVGYEAISSDAAGLILDSPSPDADPSSQD